MYIIRFPVDGAPGQEVAIGAFSYSTGQNIGDNDPGGTFHKADVASSNLDQKSFQMTVSDNSLNAGDKVDFSFTDEGGNNVIVKDAIIQQSSYGGSGGVLDGLISAIGKDQNGNDIAVHANFSKGATIAEGQDFYDNDVELNSADVVIDTPVKFIYIGTYTDIDKNEDNTDVDDPSVALTGVKASRKDVLSIVELQPVAASGGRSDAISDDDSYNGVDGDDYYSYTHPVTGEKVTPQLDSTTLTDAKITYWDGTSDSINVLALQMDNGDAFVVYDTSSKTLDGKKIHSIELTGPVVESNYDGVYDTATVGNAIICFTEKVKIQTPSGYIEAKEIIPGDIVETADNGPQPIRWVGHKKIRQEEFSRNPKLLPVRIKKGALGKGLPTEDMLVSRQHRMLIRSCIVNKMLGEEEVLVPAIKLIDIPGIDTATDVSEVTFIHILLDQHEIVFANGAPTESLLAGPEVFKAATDAAANEIKSFFPTLDSHDGPAIAARPLLKGKKVKKLIARHKKNSRPLLS